ncbi:A/G-specific adenine glycosylase [Phaeocystidibacter marisrubri]|uniref:Adenine DNA glycosylase n=1 Tax=Phaeocystidibacter marisrubri TaxID=1577780 RepID=A0A6L3ZEK8_9FLAO|nr:A/G-specific adenine glycosylase [Phaeocystidibacter marisrubri]KAB2815887.1 A/G-specific adenine glycosylase [Phaeocystidibacter marisrubri]GGH66236.1 A/G-specific adenine glycosylase [Phaeocystidibacter marisrubri]
MDLSTKLRAWYRFNARKLPWRETTDPYAIWLSEVILQQTRVTQGLPYFDRFLETFPNVESLAASSEDKLMKLWEGLGYYSRARNLHKGAKYIVENGFPTSYDEWLKVPGVGPYTAAAIASFALHEEKAVVDGNVNRVIARLFAIHEPVNSTAGRKIIEEKASALIRKNPPAEHNQAIMELGALVCSPKSPDCSICPWNTECLALATGLVNTLPVKIKKTKVMEEDLYYTAIYSLNGLYVQKRGVDGIWKSLYELIPISGNSLSLEPDMKLSSERFNTTHLLSHRKLNLHIDVIEWPIQSPELWEGYTLVRWNDIDNLAFPKPIRHWLDNNLLPLRLGSED